MDRRLSPRYFQKNQQLIATRVMTIIGEPVQAGDPIPMEIDAGTRMKLWLSGRALYATDYRPTPVQEEATVVVDEEPEVAVTHVGGGMFLVQPSWLADGHGEKVKGKEEANKRAAELLEDGPPEAVQQPNWSSFNDDPDKWDEGQRDSFDGWWNNLPEGVKIDVHHAGVAEAINRKNHEKKNPPHKPTPEEVADMVLVTQANEPEDTYLVKAAWLAEPETFSGELMANVRAEELREEGPPEGWVAPDAVE